MCWESLFTSLHLLQRFLSLYTWEKITFPLLHSPAGPVRAPGKQLLGELGRRRGRGSSSCTQSTALAAAHGVLACPARSSWCPQATGGEKGQNPKCGKGWWWDGSKIQLQKQHEGWQEKNYLVWRRPWSSHKELEQGQNVMGDRLSSHHSLLLHDQLSTRIVETMQKLNGKPPVSLFRDVISLWPE